MEKSFVVIRHRYYGGLAVRQYLKLGTESAGWYDDLIDATGFTEREANEYQKICIISGAHAVWNYTIARKTDMGVLNWITDFKKNL